LGIVCFRYVAPGLGAEALDALNRNAAEALARDGYAFLSTTVLRGRTVLRMCPINPRTEPAELRRTLELLAQAGQRLAGQARG
jgi:glutamate/tyrosine decarboxylase-like PLP-dependent enzyme